MHPANFPLRTNNPFSREPLASALPALRSEDSASRLNGRAGFTLIELIVVMSIIVVLAALGVLLVPRMLDRQRATEGSSQLQNWILLAKQKALRDQLPRGIRMNLNPAGNYVTDLQFIEQPEDLSGGINNSSITGFSTTATTPPNSPTIYTTVVTFQGIDFYNGTSDQTLWQVQPGDYLEVKGGGMVYQIQSVPPSNNSNTSSSTLVVQTTVQPPSLAIPTSGIWQYRIIRQPRVLAGEDPLQLPQDIGIDLDLSTAGTQTLHTLMAVSGNQYIDLLFSPSGNVIGSGAAYDRFNFWVRDITVPATTGDQALITVYNRSGLVAAHPIDTGVTTTSTNAVGPSPASAKLRVANAGGIAPGTILVLDPGGTTPEAVTVIAVNGTTLTLAPPVFPLPPKQPVNPPWYSHPAGVTVIINPYSFTQDGRSSGED